MIRRIKSLSLILCLTATLMSCSPKQDLVEIPVDMQKIQTEFSQLTEDDQTKEFIATELSRMSDILNLLPNDKRKAMNANDNMIKLQENLYLWTTEIGTEPSEKIENAVDYLKFSALYDNEKVAFTVDFKIIPNTESGIKLGDFDKDLLKYLDSSIDTKEVEDKLNKLIEDNMYTEEELVLGDHKYIASKSANSIILYETVTN